MIKGKNEPKNWGKNRIIINIILLSLAMLGCFGSCLLIIGNSNSWCFGTPFPSYSDVESEAYFRFPPSANNIEYTSERGSNDCTIWVKFEMRAEDFEQFKFSTQIENFAAVHFEEMPFEYLAEKAGWTQPLNPLAGHAWMGNTGQWIFIESGHRLTVYIIVHTDYL